VLEHEKAAETQIGIEKDQSQEKQRKSVKDAKQMYIIQKLSGKMH
jgi:hypothetical protein